MAFAVGMLTSTAGAFGSVREHALLLGALALGALISLDLRIPSALTVAAGAAAGLATGLDSSINNPGPRDTALAFAGVIIGVMYLTILVAGATVGLVEHWHRVGVRIVGSWIVAMALMVLALSVATPVKRATATIASPTALASPC
jgi:hydrogenase/urease accessory protein HupE